MNQSGKSPLIGAGFMIAAGICFAIINVLTQKVTSSPEGGGLGFKSTSDAFWQYAIALVFSIPFILKVGLDKMATDRPALHILRVILSALGVQAFVLGLSKGVPIWQVIALVMTSPFFILVGARLFLNERPGGNRWMAAAIGFAGVLVVLQPWADGFTAWSLLPVLAAALWGGASLITRKLTATESPESITLWLLLLLTPINLGLSVSAGFEVPTGLVLILVTLAGFLQFLAQYFLTRAYAAAEATFLQPFDDLRLPFNILAGFLAFGYLPTGNLWFGIALILSASLFLVWSEKSRAQARAA